MENTEKKAIIWQDFVKQYQLDFIIDNWRNGLSCDSRKVMNGLTGDHLVNKMRVPANNINNVQKQCWELWNDVLPVEIPEQHGIAFKVLNQQITDVLEARWEFRENKLTKSVEMRCMRQTVLRHWWVGHWYELNVNSVWYDLVQFIPKCTKEKVEAVLMGNNFIVPFDELRDWFYGLWKVRDINGDLIEGAKGSWDEKDHGDYIHRFCTYIGTDDKTDFDYLVFHMKRWMTAAVAQYMDGVPNREVLVFVSEQENIGKTQLCRHLSPMGMKYYTESGFKHNNDDERMMSGNFLIVLEELQGVDKKKMDYLKAKVSSDSCTFRSLYKNGMSSYPRTASFLATTNNINFLSSKEQNTRWVPIRITSIDWKGYLDDVACDVRNLWSQAFFYYRFEHKFDYTEEMLREKKDVAELMEEDTAEKLVVDRYISKGGKKDWVPIVTIIEAMKVKGYNLEVQALGKAMRAAGYEKQNKKIGKDRGNKWNVVMELDPYKLDTQEADNDMPF